jgi:hypothetical protein
MPATKEIVTIEQLHQPKPVAIDMEAYEAEKARRQQDRDAKRELLRECLNPVVAARMEMRKPLYRWTVSAQWLGANNDSVTKFEAEEVVVAQSEADAWALFCDRIGMWPSRRDARPVLKRGKQIAAEAVAAMAIATEDTDVAIPTVKVTAKPKTKSKA